MSERLRIRRGPPRHLHVVGELDISSAPKLAAEVQRAAGAGQGPMVLDLSELTFVDSTGLRAIVGSAQELGDPMILRNPTPQVMQVLEIAGVVGAAPNLQVETSA